MSKTKKLKKKIRKQIESRKEVLLDKSDEAAIDILKECHKNENKTEQAEFKVSKDEDLIKKSTGKETDSSSGCLYFEINENDNIVVRRLKELINSKKVRNRTISDRGYNYNVVYSLVKRNSIDFKTLEKWCDILNVDLDITFKPRSGRIF